MVMLRRYGGTEIVNRLNQELKGPSLQTVLKWAKPDVSIRYEGVQDDLLQQAIEYFQKTFCQPSSKISCEIVPVQIAIDATAILPEPCYDKVMDRVIGGVEPSDQIGNDPSIVENYVSENRDNFCKQAMCVMLVPTLTSKLQGRVIGLELLKSSITVEQLQSYVTPTLSKCTLPNKVIVEGFGSDGDSKTRKWYQHRFAKNDNTGITLEYPHFDYSAIPYNDHYVTMYPDSYHMFKKYRNNGMNARFFHLLFVAY